VAKISRSEMEGAREPIPNRSVPSVVVEELTPLLVTDFLSLRAETELSHWLPLGAMTV
jgi:hypothetical protein